jgi:hypothetical protein
VSTEPITEAQTYRKEFGKGHIYILDGQRVPGATTVLGALPKPLAKWGAEKVAELAVNEWSRLGRLPIAARLKELESAPWRDLDQAAVKGTTVHRHAEALAHGETLTLPGDVAGYVKACRAFFDGWSVCPVLTEVAVFSRRNHYGGSPDLIADLADGKRWLLDYKTGKSIWGDTGLQLAAYRYADFYLDESGSEQPIPEVDECGVIWLRPDGTFELHPYTANRSVLHVFLALKEVYLAQDDIKSYQGPSLAAPVKLSA